MSLESKEFSSKFLWWGILFLFSYISLVPFYYISPIQIPLFSVKLSLFKYIPFVSILIMLAFLIRQIFKRELFKTSLNNIAIYLFIVATLLSGIGLPYYYVSLAKAFYYFVTGALLYYLVMSVNLDIVKIRKLIKCIVIVAFWVAAYGIITFIAGKDFLFGKIYSQCNIFPQLLHFNMGRILSSLGHPDFLGSYLAILSPLFLFNVCLCHTKWKRSITWILYLTVMLAILLTFSGGAYLAFIVANSVLIFILKKERFENVKKLPFIFSLCPSIVLAIFFSVIMFAVIFNNQSINNSIFKILNPLFLGRVNFQEMLNLEPVVNRIGSFKIAWDIVKINFINGIGIGKISTGTYVLNRCSMDNMYLSIISESGLFGLGSFLFLIFMVFKILLIYYKNLMAEEHKFIVLTLFTSIVAFLTDSFYWDTYYHPTIRIIFWLIIAIITTIIKKPCLLNGNKLKLTD